MIIFNPKYIDTKVASNDIIQNGYYRDINLHDNILSEIFIFVDVTWMHYSISYLIK